MMTKKIKAIKLAQILVAPFGKSLLGLRFFTKVDIGMVGTHSFFKINLKWSLIAILSDDFIDISDRKILVDVGQI